MAYKNSAITLALWLFLPLALLAQATTPMSLDDAVNYAVANNTTLRNAQLEIADAEAQIKERLADGLPQVDGTLNYNYYYLVPQQPLPQAFVDFIQAGLPPGQEVERNVSFFLKNNFTAGVSASQLIFDGSYFLAVRAAREVRNYAQLQFDQARRTVSNSISDVYLPVLLLTENLQQLDKNITNLERLLYETRETYKAGLIEQLDVDRLDLSLANLRTERENLERQRENALRALKFAINYPLEQPLEIRDSLARLPLDLDANDLAGNINYDLRPEVQSLDKVIALNELNIKGVEKTALPSVRMSTSFQYQYQGDNLSDGFWAPTGLVGLSVNVPIYDSGRRRARVQRAQIDLQQVQTQYSDLRRSIDLEVTNARNTYQSARQRLDRRQSSLELAQRIYETTQIKYQEGIGSSIEVSQAEQSLYDAQTNYLQARYEVLAARIDLQQALGK